MIVTMDNLEKIVSAALEQFSRIDDAAALMRAVVDDPAAAARRGEAGRSSVLSRFSVEKVAAELRPLLMKAIRRW